MAASSPGTDDAPFLSPQRFYPPSRHLAQVCIITFSRHLMEEAVRRLPVRQVSSVAFTDRVCPVYAFSHAERSTALFLCPPGPAAIAAVLEEIHCRTGADRFILFGAASSLNRIITTGQYLIPDSVAGDDGITRAVHPRSGEMPFPASAFTQSFFADQRIPFVAGRFWSCEALYHMTRDQIRVQKLNGALAMEMHLAAAQAVCDARQWQLYAFFLPGDLLDGSEWEAGDLTHASHAPESLDMALRLAQRIPLRAADRNAPKTKNGAPGVSPPKNGAAGGRAPESAAKGKKRKAAARPPRNTEGLRSFLPEDLSEMIEQLPL